MKPFAPEWDALSESKQKSLRRWAAKSPDERSRIRQRYREWKQLSPDQQHTVTKQLKRYRQMSATQRAKLKTWYQWIHKLPEAERAKLRSVWAGLDEAGRKAYIDALQARYGSL